MPEHHFETRSPVTLEVEIGRGRVRVDAVETMTTTVTVDGDRADDVRVEQAGGEIRVIAPRQGLSGLLGEARVDVTVSLPTGSRVGARLGSADLVVSGTVAAARVRCGSGDVVLAVVDGDLTVETGSGDVRVERVGGSAEVRSGSGDVAVGTAAAGCAVSTGSGDVRIGEAHHAPTLKTGSGDVLVEVAHDGLSLATGSGDLRVRRASRGRVTARSASGAVELAVPAGVPVWTDITTVTGRIRSTLAATGEPEPGQDHLEVRATTVSGDVLLTQA